MHSQRGATLIEAAIVFPLLIMMIIGVAELGLTYLRTIQLRSSVAEVARAQSTTLCGSSSLTPVAAPSGYQTYVDTLTSEISSRANSPIGGVAITSVVPSYSVPPPVGGAITSEILTLASGLISLERLDLNVTAQVQCVACALLFPSGGGRIEIRHRVSVPLENAGC